MEKDHFEILLEEMRHNFQLAFEGLDGVNQRLDRLEVGQAKLEQGQARLEYRQAKLEQQQAKLEHGYAKLEHGQEELKDDVKDIKRSMGILLPIARDHEARLQALEETIRNR